VGNIDVIFGLWGETMNPPYSRIRSRIVGRMFDTSFYFPKPFGKKKNGGGTEKRGMAGADPVPARRATKIGKKQLEHGLWQGTTVLRACGGLGFGCWAGLGWKFSHGVLWASSVSSAGAGGPEGIRSFPTR